jgi:predicted nucleotidyltransferase
MVLTHSDYTNEVNLFLEAISELDDDLCSVILYGSLVKGTVRPGLSDLLDAVVVVQSRLLADESSYYRTVDLMLSICSRLEATGAPFHPFHYFALDPPGWSAVALYVPTWTSDRYSRIVAGTDVRPLLRTSDLELRYMRGWYFGMSHWFRRRAFFLSAVLNRQEGAHGVLPALREFTRNHPQFACFACNRPIDRAEALDEIAVLFPNVDIDSLQRLSEKAESALTDISTQDARRLLNEGLRLNESLYQSVASWVSQDKPA